MLGLECVKATKRTEEDPFKTLEETGDVSSVDFGVRASRCIGLKSNV